MDHGLARHGTGLYACARREVASCCFRAKRGESSRLTSWTCRANGATLAFELAFEERSVTATYIYVRHGKVFRRSAAAAELPAGDPPQLPPSLPMRLARRAALPALPGGCGSPATAASIASTHTRRSCA